MRPFNFKPIKNRATRAPKTVTSWAPSVSDILPDLDHVEKPAPAVDSWSKVSSRHWDRNPTWYTPAERQQYADDLGYILRGYYERGLVTTASCDFVSVGWISFFEYLFERMHRYFNGSTPLLTNFSLLKDLLNIEPVIDTLRKAAGHAMLDDGPFKRLSAHAVSEMPAERSLSVLMQDCYTDLASFVSWLIVSTGNQKLIVDHIPKENRRPIAKGRLMEFNGWWAICAVGCAKYQALCEVLLKPAIEKIIAKRKADGIAMLDEGFHNRIKIQR